MRLTLHSHPVICRMPVLKPGLVVVPALLTGVLRSPHP